MCTGAELALISGSAQGAGMLASANAAKNSSASTQIQLNFQADMAKINERLNESNAQTSMLVGQRQEQNVRLRTAQLKSTQRASMAANGIDLGSDTALNVLTTTDYMGEVDALQTATNAVRQAWGYRTNAQNFASEASMKRASASGIDPNSSYMTSLLGNAGTVATNWYMMNKGTGLGTSSRVS